MTLLTLCFLVKPEARSLAQGTSVVLYRSKAIRRHQYTRITEWSGGLYISPGAAPAHLTRGIAVVTHSQLYDGKVLCAGDKHHLA